MGCFIDHFISIPAIISLLKFGIFSAEFLARSGLQRFQLEAVPRQLDRRGRCSNAENRYYHIYIYTYTPCFEQPRLDRKGN